MPMETHDRDDSGAAIGVGGRSVRLWGSPTGEERTGMDRQGNLDDSTPASDHLSLCSSVKFGVSALVWRSKLRVTQ
ncbi:hypothetical protein N7539_004712 [Penicillium diatomitis]|uniref:Uncharacterized protein n=1 Tax=Penicillium diatomitis TaxID=2819901 RepID=A0A9X0BU22_9EURO|nr:uncharacterized protein N7539_004712 [Penicillium diatomitis]KAJ5484724.1 hypothetical protein N7539_004712 [Penicillium diatomitis]